MVKTEFGTTAMYRILKNAGATRISDESVEEFRRTMQEIADALAKDAVEMANHAKRRTIQGQDIKMAMRHYRI